MPISHDGFDPIAVAVDWLDAGKLGDLDGLLDLYDERATLECDCEGVALTGRESAFSILGTKARQPVGSRIHPRRYDSDR